jgi:putative transposase
MEQDNVVSIRRPDPPSGDPLTEVLRHGARALLAQAVEAEVAAFLAAHAGLVDEAGRRRLVRNGFLPERAIQTGIGAVPVRQPRVRDRGARRRRRLGADPLHLGDPAPLPAPEPQPRRTPALALPQGPPHR